MRQTLFIILTCSILLAFAKTDVTMDKHDYTPISGFELDRYLGTWYEIARYPHSFEKNLQGVTATYSMRKDGKVKVLNAGYKDNLSGKLKTANGKAKLAGDPDTGHLKVSFFLFFYGDYFIMDMDKENYQWALVGSSSPNYLWLLSRTAKMDEALYNKILQTAVNKGYDLSKLQVVEQP